MVLPTPVSVPVMKKRSGMNSARTRKSRQRVTRRRDLGHQADEVFEADLAGQGQANARRARRNCRRPDRLHREPTCLQPGRNVHRRFVAAEQYGNDVRCSCSTPETAGTERLAQRGRDLRKVSAPVICFANKSNSCSNLVCQVWRHCRAENERSRPIHEIVFERAATAYESTGAGESFPAGMHDREDFAFTPVLGSYSSALRSKNPD